VFDYEHLPAHLQDISRPFYDLAHQVAGTLTGPEVTRALEALFSAKNWAVVAAVTAGAEAGR
jgi:hypothetical protein